MTRTGLEFRRHLVKALDDAIFTTESPGDAEMIQAVKDIHAARKAHENRAEYLRTEIARLCGISREDSLGRTDNELLSIAWSRMKGLLKDD